jgi:ribosomal protein S18 acetylase RimI-like enzyme
MGGITVRPLRGRQDLLRFIKLPWSIYDGDINWVPPLISERKKVLNRQKNPLFKHAEMELFLAERDGEPVGRIASTINHLHNSFHHENIGFFGFFESVNDPKVSSALFDAARNWLTSKGVKGMRGPASPSMNEECGLLVKGFEGSPTILMPYNPPYYAELFHAYGLEKVMDLYAYRVTKEAMSSGKVPRLAELIRKRESVVLRPVDMKNFRRDVELVKDIYNHAWVSNWGFVPMTNEEIDFLAEDLKPIIEPECALFAEVRGKAVGFILALPDINVVLRKIRNGRLFPFGFLKFPLYRSQIHLLRIVVGGVIKEYQKRGIDALLYAELFRRGVANGYNEAEASWILETNKLMLSGIKAVGGVHTKTYRMYEMRFP